MELNDKLSEDGVNQLGGICDRIWSLRQDLMGYIEDIGGRRRTEFSPDWPCSFLTGGAGREIEGIWSALPLFLNRTVLTRPQWHQKVHELYSQIKTHLHEISSAALSGNTEGMFAVIAVTTDVLNEFCVVVSEMRHPEPLDGNQSPPVACKVAPDEIGEVKPEGDVSGSAEVRLRELLGTPALRYERDNRKRLVVEFARNVPKRKSRFRQALADWLFKDEESDEDSLTHLARIEDKIGSSDSDEWKAYANSDLGLEIQSLVSDLRFLRKP